MHIVSVNVGQPREIRLNDRLVLTSIFKQPVEGRVPVRNHNLQGDRQADLRVHGGPYKAVYAYSSEHYPYWAEDLGVELAWGNFGENLTTVDLTEESTFIGDQFRVGSAVLQVTQPRMPCFKLNLRFGRSDIVKRFWRCGFSGIYFSIIEEGELAAGDQLQLVHRVPNGISVADVVRVYKGEIDDEQVFQLALKAPLRGSWKEEIQERRAERTLPLFTKP